MRVVSCLLVIGAVSMFLMVGCQQKPPDPTPKPVGVQDPLNPGEIAGTGDVPPGPVATHGSDIGPVGDPGTVAPPTGGERTYTVKAHDGLMSIARTQLGNPHRWKEILQLNPDIKDPNQLKVGQVIKLPAK